jgi:hypothetical protein
LKNFNFKIKDGISKLFVLVAMVAKIYFQILVRKIIKKKEKVDKEKIKNKEI